MNIFIAETVLAEDRAAHECQGTMRDHKIDVHKYSTLTLVTAVPNDLAEKFYTTTYAD